MKVDNIILEDRFTTHQKITILLYMGAPFIILIVKLIMECADLSYFGFLVLVVLSIIYSIMVCISFTKRGFVKVKSNLYRGLFFRQKLI